MVDTVEKPAKKESPWKHNGGARPGSGRPPKPKDPTLLAKAYALLDQSTLPALQAIVELLTAEEPRIRLEAAKLILAKSIPDLQHNSGAVGGMTVNIHYGHQSIEQRVVVAQPLAGHGASH